MKEFKMRCLVELMNIVYTFKRSGLARRSLVNYGLNGHINYDDDNNNNNANNNTSKLSHYCIFHANF